MAHQDKENDIEEAGRRLQIRNSTVDFLVFTKDAGEDGIEVRVQNYDVWLTQKAIAKLFYSLSAIIALGYRTNLKVEKN